MRIRDFSLLFIIVLCTTELLAQETVLVSGGNASGGGGSISYSLGQVVYTTNTGTNGSVAQGVQQVYEIIIIDGIEEANVINLICKAFPNPTTDFLTLNIENYESANLFYQLFDISGKLLEYRKLTNSEITIDMSIRIDGTYLLKVIDSHEEIKTFKIIKE